MFDEGAKSGKSLADDVSDLSLNGAEEPTKTPAQFNAAEIVRIANELITDKKYDEALIAIKPLPNKQRREFKSIIAGLKQAEEKLAKKAEMADSSLSKNSESKLNGAETFELDMVSLFHETVSKSNNPILDRPEFLGPVEKRWISDQKGFGVVATRDIEPGELLIASKAISIAINDADDGSQKAAINFSRCHLEITLSRIASSERRKREFYELYAGPGFRRYLPDEPIPATVDPLRVVLVLKFNAFGFSVKPSRLAKGLHGRGLWPLPSFINHSCAPNCSRLCFGDFMVVRAQEKISQGEELTLCYASTEPDECNYQQRQAKLSSYYGINCACPLCECDKENLRINPQLNTQRAKFIEAFDRDYRSLRLSSASPAKVREFFKDSLAQFEPLTYKNRHDVGLGVDALWYARSPNRGNKNQASVDINKAWSALTGECSGSPNFVGPGAYDPLRFCVLGLFNLQREGNARGPEAIDLATKLLKYAKIEYGAQQPLEMLLLMHPDDEPTETAISITRKLLKAL